MVDFYREKPKPRPRRQTMILFASLLLGWVAVEQFRGAGRTAGSRLLDHPPQFFVDLPSATEDELQLLPEVGPKTAHAWRQTLDDSSISTPRSPEELEQLPHVGPIRSSKLAPFLVESEARSSSVSDPTAEVSRPSANR